MLKIVFRIPFLALPFVVVADVYFTTCRSFTSMEEPGDDKGKVPFFRPILSTIARQVAILEKGRDTIMGVFLTSLVKKVQLPRTGLQGKILAVDGNGMLYGFLATFRRPDGALFKDSRGNVTSHLHGVVRIAVSLVADSGIKPVFVFDGEAPYLKKEELDRRKALKERYAREYEEARKAGLVGVAFSKAVRAARITPSMTADARRLLDLLGIPNVQAPSEGEAQAAFMVKREDAWAVAGRDYDTLLFGGPRMVALSFLPNRNLLSGGEEPGMPSAQLIDLEETLGRHHITRDQLIDVAILIGNDYNDGVRGMSTRQALDLVKKYRNIEGLPPELKMKVSKNYREVRDFFINPPVTDAYRTNFGEVDENGLYDFLLKEKDFPPEAIERAVEKMRKARGQVEG
jgi:flap endonuclease-1